MTSFLAKTFVDLLKADLTVTAFCGTRIFPNRAPQNVTYPYVVWLEVSTSTYETHDDAMGLDSTDVQFSCYSPDLKTALDLRSAIRKSLLTNDLGNGIKVINPITRTISEDEINLANAMLDVTFQHNPSLT